MSLPSLAVFPLHRFHSKMVGGGKSLEWELTEEPTWICSSLDAVDNYTLLQSFTP